MNEKKPLFFSGGTALKGLSQYFARIKFPTYHIITVFDSGGSSAALRKSFSAPAVGDLRNRLLALADIGKTSPAMLAFCNSRLPRDVSPAEARRLLDGILASPLLGDIPAEFQQTIRPHLSYFLEKVPANFDARGASMGNLLLIASWLKNHGDLEAALAFFTSFFHICGAIAPVVDSSLHMGARLKDGRIIVGQHLFASLPAPVERIFLTVRSPESAKEPVPICRPKMAQRARELIGRAGLVCYPMGSFYSSVLVNLLAKGAGESVAASRAPKVFIPNSGGDHETGQMGLAEQTLEILDRLREDAPKAAISDLMNFVLLDLQNGAYPGDVPASLELLRSLGIQVLDRPIMAQDDPSRHEPEPLFSALTELMKQEAGA